jgi:hypothetical protein
MSQSRRNRAGLRVRWGVSEDREGRRKRGRVCTHSLFTNRPVGMVFSLPKSEIEAEEGMVVMKRFA